MSRIDIEHRHSLAPAQAREAIDTVASKLSEKFSITSRWDGDSLLFSRSGVDGRIQLAPGVLHVQAKLGFLTAMFKQPIQDEIRRVLKERF